jgi:uncharacterized glyoxalase superfamily protein PhnB
VITSVQDVNAASAYGAGMVIPTFKYDDAPAAIDFLERAFGFERKNVFEGDGLVHHAELTHGRGMVMLGSVGAGDPQFETKRSSVYVVVPDADAAYERAKAAGAEITRELQDTDYGSREFAARDPEGNVWSFGTYDPFAA